MNSVIGNSVIGAKHLEAVQASFQQVEMASEITIAGLMSAALIGHTSAIKALLEKGATADAKDDQGRTPLMEASFAGHSETVRALLDSGAAVNAQDHDGWTALMEAASKGHTEIVRLLLSRGADTKIKNHKGCTALQSAAKANVKIARLLKHAHAL
ncbi:MAG: ankyrin repeat domain-containing protein [Acidobacteria bacterium]|nr:ankyrin repeat domain-containing protein [Acidobacteriota bacterium]